MSRLGDARVEPLDKVERGQKCRHFKVINFDWRSCIAERAACVCFMDEAACVAP